MPWMGVGQSGLGLRVCVLVTITIRLQFNVERHSNGSRIEVVTTGLHVRVVFETVITM